MDLQMQGKRAIVTGASRGIGLAIATALANEGVEVMLVARGPQALAEASAHLAGLPGRVVFASADTTDDASVRQLIDTTVAELGGIDILVNAAATPTIGDRSNALESLVDDDLRHEIETKVLGYLRTARAAAPHMAANGWGRIINISGLGARQTGSPFGSIRNVAVAALTKNLADELGATGINVTVVHPGPTVTERTPELTARIAASRDVSLEEAEAQLGSSTSIGRLVTSAEVADVVAFLASPRSIAINGDAVSVGGGSRGAIHY